MSVQDLAALRSALDALCADPTSPASPLSPFQLRETLHRKERELTAALNLARSLLGQQEEYSLEIHQISLDKDDLAVTIATLRHENSILHVLGT